MGNTTGGKTYLVGAEGREQIKRMMSLGKSQQAILDFGSDNGLDIPASESIYGVLDMLGKKRRDIHAAALDSVMHAAMNRIKGEPLPLDQHLALLAKVKHYLAVPQLREIPLMLLAKWPDNVPEDYRETIRGNKQLYEACDVNVKRALWREDLPLFQQHMRPLLAKYVADNQLRTMSQEICGTRAHEYSRRRRENQVLLDIARSINRDLHLYNATLGMIREMFTVTQDPALGTLRLDLAMVMHESDLRLITESDVCHGLAWSLDACIMRQTLDARRIHGIREFFDSIYSENQLYGEVALVLSSPYVRHIMAQHILEILELIAPKSEATDKHRDLNWPSLMLTIGLSASHLLAQDRPNFPAVNRDVTKKFYPSLIAFIKESARFDRAASARDADTYSTGAKRVRRDSTGAYSGRSGTAGATVTEESGLRPSQEDLMLINTSELARQTLYAYLLKRVTACNFGMLNMWLPYISKAVPVFLGLPEGTIKDQLEADSPDGKVSGPNPPQVAIVAENQIPAFEIDAFIQSLVSTICSTRGALATLLNTISNTLDQQTQQKTVDHINIPLLSLLDTVGQVRHTAHEQAIVLLTEFERILTAEYSNAMPGHRPNAAHAAADAGRVPIQNKESAVYFIYQFAERVASHYAVDPARRENLKREYAQLETGSPQQAFKYRICAANCLNCSKFL